MKEELHLFIIWENARNKQEEIVNDIKEKFEIINIYDMNWSKNKFSNNLSRFYGTNLPDGSAKEQHCGNGKFLLIIVKDTNPQYEERMTSKGPKIVNINMFDKKELYRKNTGGGHKIHATNDEKETNHDITLLLGKNVEDYKHENQEKWNGKIEDINLDLFGCDGWNSVEKMFYVLNNCTNYAILRNYESLPDEIYQNDHNDIDLICESLQDTAYVLNAEPVFKEDYRVHYKTNVEDRIAYFDLRFVGDDYYYLNIEKDILNNRIFNEKGFFTLNKEDYFYTLLYHALIQKPEFKKDYKLKLRDMNIETLKEEETIEKYSDVLKKWMLKKEYIITEPKDKSVAFNIQHAQLFEPFIYKSNKEEEYKEKINELKKENNEQKERILELTRVLEGIQCSRTWKITEPIRKLKKKFSRG